MRLLVKQISAIWLLQLVISSPFIGVTRVKPPLGFESGSPA